MIYFNIRDKTWEILQASLLCDLLVTFSLKPFSEGR